MAEIEFFATTLERVLGAFAVEVTSSTMLSPKDEKFRTHLLFYYMDVDASGAEKVEWQKYSDLLREQIISKDIKGTSISRPFERSHALDLISDIRRHMRNLFLDRLPTISEKELETRFNSGLRSGAIFLELLKQWSRDESVNVSTAIKSIADAGGSNRHRGLGIKTLNNSWTGWRSASHLWAALIDLRAEGKPLATGGNYLVCDLEGLPRLLARAERFREAGIAIRYSDHTRAPSILADEDTWRVPAYVRGLLPEDL